MGEERNELLEISLYDFVKVKLSQSGVKYYTDYIDNFADKYLTGNVIEEYRGEIIRQYKESLLSKLSVDDNYEAYLEIELYAFANILGPKLFIGSDILADTNIEIRRR